MSRQFSYALLIAGRYDCIERRRRPSASLLAQPSSDGGRGGRWLPFLAPSSLEMLRHRGLNSKSSHAGPQSDPGWSALPQRTTAMKSSAPPQPCCNSRDRDRRLRRLPPRSRWRSIKHTRSPWAACHKACALFAFDLRRITPNSADEVSSGPALLVRVARVRVRVLRLARGGHHPSWPASVPSSSGTRTRLKTRGAWPVRVRDMAGYAAD